MLLAEHFEHFSRGLPHQMGREHPGEEHRQLVGQHHPAVQKQATSRSSQADELLGNPRQVSFVAKAVVDVVDVAFVAVATAVVTAAGFVKNPFRLGEFGSEIFSSISLSLGLFF